MSMSGYYLGIDLGTSSVKVLATDGKNTVKAKRGYAEISVHGWLVSAREAVRETVGRLENAEIQKESFKKYAEKYGKFDADPAKMTLHRMEFNVKYRLGDYQKIILNDKIIGGIFGFMLEEESTWHVAQFYILPDYEHLGYGTKAMDLFFELHKDVKIWYADTIKQETKNVEFYQKFGFKIIDEEEEHDGLTFVTLIKK